MSHPNLLDCADTVLLVVDVQDPLLNAIYERERVIDNTVRLIEAAKILDVPVLVTLQYAARFGGCTQAVADVLPHDTVVDKTTFSCMGGANFPQILEETTRRQVLICGVEAHVCVSQTAHDMLARGFSVHLAKDAVSSRTPENWITGVEKMRDSGCIITSTEMAIFELIQDASRVEFKKILPIVK